MKMLARKLKNSPGLEVSDGEAGRLFEISDVCKLISLEPWGQSLQIFLFTSRYGFEKFKKYSVSYLGPRKKFWTQKAGFRSKFLLKILVLGIKFLSAGPNLMLVVWLTCQNYTEMRGKRFKAQGLTDRQKSHKTPVKPGRIGCDGSIFSNFCSLLMLYLWNGWSKCSKSFFAHLYMVLAI